MKAQDKLQRFVTKLERARGAEFACRVFEKASRIAIPKYKPGSGQEILFGLVLQEMETLMAK